MLNYSFKAALIDLFFGHRAFYQLLGEYLEIKLLNAPLPYVHQQVANVLSLLVPGRLV